MDIGILFSILIGSVFVNNFVLARFLGICPLLSENRQPEDSVNFGMTMIFVMTVTSASTWVINKYILEGFKIEYIRTVVFISVIIGLVRMFDFLLYKIGPNMHKRFGVLLPTLTTSCAVLGVALINVLEKIGDRKYGFIEATLNGLASAVGFTLVLVVFAEIQDRLRYSKIPDAFKGVSIILVTIGLMAVAFMGFSCIKI